MLFAARHDECTTGDTDASSGRRAPRAAAPSGALFTADWP